jgi:fatty-acyl-CoA synthase
MAWYVSNAIEALARHGGKTALSYRGRDLTYPELLTSVYRTARALARRGLRRGDGLVLVSGNRPEAFVVRYAAFLLGLRFTPLVPGLTDVSYVVADSGAVAVLGEADLPELMAAADRESTDPLPVAAQEEDIARVLYTGGTTGLPKGVPSSYAALGAATRAWGASVREMPADLRFLLVTPFAHGSGDAAFNLLGQGVTVEILDGFEPDEFVAAVPRSAMVVSYLYPSWLYRLLDHLEDTGAELDALQFLSYGSAPIAPARLRQALARFGPILLQTYATTEAPAIAMLDQAGHAAAMGDRPELLGSVGRPLPGIDVELRAEDGSLVPAGDVGEVCVRGASVMAGYWHRPELTATTLRDGWLHTGDLGRMDADGYLYLVGRLKDMIIVDGYNHYAGPIEDALTSHPGVSDAAVVGAPDERTGEAIHAFVVARDVSGDELRASVREPIATVTFLDVLPLTPLGKPDKNALRQRVPSRSGTIG